MKKFLLIAMAAMTASALLANNIVVSHVSLTGNNTGSQYVMVKFDLSWDNSWHVTSGPSNWDAAWVFIKYRIKSQNAWSHATLHYADGSGSGDGHILTGGAAISSDNDNGAGGAYGVFIYHNSPAGQASVSYPGTELRWDYGVNGVPDADSVDIRVYAVEMVYVPQGSFSLGSGGAEKDAFFSYPDSTQTYSVTSENAIPVGAVNGQLYYHNFSGNGGDGAGPIPAAFPKGYKAFYCMKYEITQDQYTAFLATLTVPQANFRLGYLSASIGAFGSLASRNGITGSTPANVATSNPFLPCNFINWFDLTAYLDWSALRPLTEMEYEKACRGTAAPVPNEFAWGSNSVVNYNQNTKVITTGNPYAITGSGTISEGIGSNYSNTGNAYWLNSSAPLGLATVGPLRAGIFAGNAGNTGRASAGATFYGIMEMSGNVAEQVVTAGNADGRAFTGLQGNGQLGTLGDMDVPNWPYPNPFGMGIRGNGFVAANPLTGLMVSDRSQAAANYVDFYGQAVVGGRGVRTAP